MRPSARLARLFLIGTLALVGCASSSTSSNPEPAKDNVGSFRGATQGVRIELRFTPVPGASDRAKLEELGPTDRLLREMVDDPTTQKLMAHMSGDHPVELAFGTSPLPKQVPAPTPPAVAHYVVAAGAWTLKPDTMANGAQMLELYIEDAETCVVDNNAMLAGPHDGFAAMDSAVHGSLRRTLSASRGVAFMTAIRESIERRARGWITSATGESQPRSVVEAEERLQKEIETEAAKGRDLWSK